MTAALVRAREAGEMTWNGVKFECVRANDLGVADVICTTSKGFGLSQCHVIATDNGSRGESATLRNTVYVLTTDELEIRINDNRWVWRATQVDVQSQGGGAGADNKAKKSKKKVHVDTHSRTSDLEPKYNSPQQKRAAEVEARGETERDIKIEVTTNKQSMKKVQFNSHSSTST
jgi:hypothetical protein